MRLAPALALALFLSACAAAPPAPVDQVGAATFTGIGQIQGNGDASPLQGQTVRLRAVLVASYPGLNLLAVQSLPGQEDNDPASSEGLWVQPADRAVFALALGSVLEIEGAVREAGRAPATATTLEATAIRSSGHSELPPPLQPPRLGDWEHYEGMRVQIAEPLLVAGNDTLRLFGELRVSRSERRYAPTEAGAPGEDARRVAASNRADGLLLDDGQLGENPETIAWLGDRPGPRVGSTVQGLQGVVDQRFGRYRLQADAAIARIDPWPAPPPPKVGGDVRIASLNVLNLFNGDGQGGGFPTPRGAPNAGEYQQQRSKLVAMLQALDADIAAVMEMENDGFGPQSSLAQFVAALNAAGPARDWRFVHAGEGPGQDQIRVAILYRETRVSLVGPALTGPSDGPFARGSRVPLAQAFRSGAHAPFLVVANHFKSKSGCDRAEGDDRDRGDGQQCFNATRVASAVAVHEWLYADPAGLGSTRTILLGDLNSHSQEDPIRALKERGWQDAFEVFRASLPPREAFAASASNERAYSYQFGGEFGRLDHVLLSAGFDAKLTGIAEWHINADEEPGAGYEYNDDVSPRRSSDHDPLLLGLRF